MVEKDYNIDILQELLGCKSKNETIQLLVKYVVRGFEFYSLYGDNILTANLRLKVTRDTTHKKYIEFMSYAVHIKHNVDANGLKWVTEEFMCGTSRCNELCEYVDILHTESVNWKVHGKAVFNGEI